MFEINKTYKIKDVEGIHYTATILEETEDHISFLDFNGEKQGLRKEDIAKWKQIENSTEGEQ